MDPIDTILFYMTIPSDGTVAFVQEFDESGATSLAALGLGTLAFAVSFAF